jgi:hypothetical protein
LVRLETLKIRSLLGGASVALLLVLAAGESHGHRPSESPRAPGLSSAKAGTHGQETLVAEVCTAQPDLHHVAGRARTAHPSASLFWPRNFRLSANAAASATATRVRQLGVLLSLHQAADRPTVMTMPACGPPTAAVIG